MDLAVVLYGLPGGQDALRRVSGRGGAGGGPAGRAPRMASNVRSWGSSRDATVRSTCPSRAGGRCAGPAQIVRVRPATLCRIVTACRPDTMVTIPLGGTPASNSTAALRGTGPGGGSITPVFYPRHAILSSRTVGKVTLAPRARAGRNLLAGTAIPATVRPLMVIAVHPAVDRVLRRLDRLERQDTWSSSSARSVLWNRSIFPVVVDSGLGEPLGMPFSRQTRSNSTSTGCGRCAGRELLAVIGQHLDGTP